MRWQCRRADAAMLGLEKNKIAGSIGRSRFPMRFHRLRIRRRSLEGEGLLASFLMVFSSVFLFRVFDLFFKFYFILFCLEWCSYQLEALEKALRENTIAFLETGSGKTLIAIMLLRKYAYLLRKPSDFIAVFLVPTVVLVQQVSVDFQQLRVTMLMEKKVWQRKRRKKREKVILGLHEKIYGWIIVI